MLNRDIDQHKMWDIEDVDPKRRGGMQEDGKGGLVLTEMGGEIFEGEGLVD